MPSDPRYPLQSLFTPGPGRIWSNGDCLVSELLKVLPEDQLLKLIDGSEQAYPRKHVHAIECRNPMQGIMLSNAAASAGGDAGGSLTSRLLYFPFHRSISDTVKSTVLIDDMKVMEAPIFLVVASTLYRCFVHAVGSDPLQVRLIHPLFHPAVVCVLTFVACCSLFVDCRPQMWYPLICIRLKREIAENVSGFVRFLHARTVAAEGHFIDMQTAIKQYMDHLKANPNKDDTRQWEKIRSTKRALHDSLVEANFEVCTAKEDGSAARSSVGDIARLNNRRWLEDVPLVADAFGSAKSVMDGGLVPTDAVLLTKRLERVMLSLRGNFTEEGGNLSSIVNLVCKARQADQHPVRVSPADAVDPALHVAAPIVVDLRNRRKRPRGTSHVLLFVVRVVLRLFIAHCTLILVCGLQMFRRKQTRTATSRRRVLMIRRWRRWTCPPRTRISLLVRHRTMFSLPPRPQYSADQRRRGGMRSSL